MSETVDLRPQEGPQERFLQSDADICIYGGAAGGGKSYALLLEPIRHINNPKFGAVIFRKNSNQITAEGGLWDTSATIYPLLEAEPVQTPRAKWTFPSGATVSFAHLQYENDKYSWQGTQIPLLCFDELTHFSESQFFYMLSRNRSTCGVKPYIRATTNPDASSWVADFISWWIDQETGYAIPERSGVIRYMTRIEDTIYWGDSPEELKERFSFIENLEPKSVTFIASKLSDNKILMEADPGYLSNLQSQSKVERERLLNGNWKIMPAAGMYFPRQKVNLIETLPTNIQCFVRAWDFAATEDRKNAKTNNTGPAKTAGVLMAKTKQGRYVIVDVINKAMKADDVRNTVLTTAKLDKQNYKKVRIRLSQDPGQAGKDQAEQYIKMLEGYNVTAVRESGDKETRAEPFSAQWEAGNVDILEGAWNKEYIEQMDNFPEDNLKDMVDASANAFNEIVMMNTPKAPSTNSIVTGFSKWR